MEYEVCILGLKMALEMRNQRLLVFGDFELVIKQTIGYYNTKELWLLPNHQYEAAKLTVNQNLLLAYSTGHEWFHGCLSNYRIIDLFVEEQITLQRPMGLKLATRCGEPFFETRVMNFSLDSFRIHPELRKYTSNNSTLYLPPLVLQVESCWDSFRSWSLTAT